jgi:four helix bundle protein
MRRIGKLENWKLINLKNKHVLATINDLRIWKWREAVSIGVDIYKLTSGGKLEKDYASRDQLRRAALSISNNIAGGVEYNNSRTFIKFLSYAKASASELRSNLFVLTEAELIDQIDRERLLTKVVSASKNIAGFIKYLRTYVLKTMPKRNNTNL